MPAEVLALVADRLPSEADRCNLGTTCCHARLAAWQHWARVVCISLFNSPERAERVNQLLTGLRLARVHCVVLNGNTIAGVALPPPGHS